MSQATDLVWRAAQQDRSNIHLVALIRASDTAKETATAIAYADELGIEVVFNYCARIIAEAVDRNWHISDATKEKFLIWL